MAEYQFNDPVERARTASKAQHMGATCVSMGGVAKEPLEMICVRCNRVLMQIPIGGSIFIQVYGKCDCDWRCCEHSKPGAQHHTNHIAYRSIATGKIIGQSSDATDNN